MFVKTNAGLGLPPAPPPHPQGEDWLPRQARSEEGPGEIQAFPPSSALKVPGNTDERGAGCLQQDEYVSGWSRSVCKEFTDQNLAAHAVIVRVPDICFLTQLWKKKKCTTNAVLESKHNKVTSFWTESTYNRNASGYTCFGLLPVLLCWSGLL